ncbi:MAG: hypothetical protein LBM16_00575 [Clostridiales bacterium]|jgi:flagellin|nr:hypothetical protein [Clostridiales bacterium]
MRIANNIPALASYTAVSGTGKKVSASMLRLSSGYRINSVGDDAAGLAIANKMSRRVKAIDMASRNSLDAVSLIQTASGAFKELNDMVIRIRELAVQCSNDTMEPSDRQKADEEVQQLKEEITSISQHTEFNGIKVLNGDAARFTSVKDKSIAKVTYVSDKLDNSFAGGLVFNVPEPTPASFGFEFSTSTDPLSPELVGEKITINGEDIEVEETDTIVSLTTKLTDLVKNLGATVAGTTVTSTKAGSQSRFEIKVAPALSSVFSYNNLQQGTGAASPASFDFKFPEPTDPLPMDLVGKKLKINKEYIQFEKDDNAATLTAKFKGLVDSLGATIEETTAEGTTITTVKSIDAGSQIRFAVDGDSALISLFGIENLQQGADMVVSDGATYNGQPVTCVVDGRYATFTTEQNETIKVEVFKSTDGDFKAEVLDFGQLRFQVGADKNTEIHAQIPCVSAKAIGLEFGAVTTWDSSQRLIDLCDNALEFLSREQAKLGAKQNHLDYTNRSLDNTSVNTAHALSRIRDTDMAAEIAELTKNQVISQAGMSILAQANQRPQQVLQILN